MNGNLVRRKIMLRLHFLGELQHTNKHRRHPLRMGDLVFFDQLQHTFRVKMIHDDACATNSLNRHVIAKRCSVVEWCRGEIHGLFVHPV